MADNQIILTKDQSWAYNEIMGWFELEKDCNAEYDVFTLGGFAGTGKSTLIGYLADQMRIAFDINIAFCAFSGKASLVMKNKISLGAKDYCGTIHSLIYSLRGKDKETRELYFERNDCDLDYDLIIVDEASMVNEYIYNDLKSFGIPILAVGDHGQLPPVKGAFNLMKDPDIKLEKIMRQAEGNPIIKLSMMAREGLEIPFDEWNSILGYAKKCRNFDFNQHDFSDANSIIICGSNQYRLRYNNFARDRLGHVTKKPNEGEQVICLMNDRNKMIFNGMIGTVLECKDYDDFRYDAIIHFPGYKNPTECLMWKDQFLQKYTLDVEDLPEDVAKGINQFDYAYCITAHKSQGSEWANVIIIDQYMPWLSENDRRRWLYTAITRAKERLIIIKK